jgi:hypothetical protein
MPSCLSDNRVSAPGLFQGSRNAVREISFVALREQTNLVGTDNLRNASDRRCQHWSPAG